MFSILGQQNDHPGWNHFNLIEPDTIVCEHCSLCYVDVDEHELLLHMTTYHSDVNFTWMRYAIEGRDKEKAPSPEEVSPDEVKAELNESINVTNVEIGMERLSTSEEHPVDVPSPPSSSTEPTEALPASPPIETPPNGPRVAPGTTPTPCTSKTLAACEADLGEEWTVVNRYSTTEEYNIARKSYKVHSCGGYSLFGVSINNSYCHRRHKDQCVYVMRGFKCPDQCGLYEKGKHNHAEDDQPMLPRTGGTPKPNSTFDWTKFDETLKKTRKCKNGELTLDDIRKHIPRSWKLYGTYNTIDEMETARKSIKVNHSENGFAELNKQWRRAMLQCEEKDQYPGCQYFVAAFFSKSEFALFFRYFHCHYEKKPTTPKCKPKKRVLSTGSVESTPQKLPRSSTLSDPLPEDLLDVPVPSVGAAVGVPVPSASEAAVDVPVPAVDEAPVSATQSTRTTVNPMPFTPTVSAAPSTPTTSASVPRSRPTNPALTNVSNLPRNVSALPEVVVDSSRRNSNAVNNTGWRCIGNYSKDDDAWKHINTLNVRLLGIYPNPTENVHKELYKCRHKDCKYQVKNEHRGRNWDVFEFSQHNH